MPSEMARPQGRRSGRSRRIAQHVVVQGDSNERARPQEAVKYLSSCSSRMGGLYTMSTDHHHHDHLPVQPADIRRQHHESRLSKHAPTEREAGSHLLTPPDWARRVQMHHDLASGKSPRDLFPRSNFGHGPPKRRSTNLGYDDVEQQRHRSQDDYQPESPCRVEAADDSGPDEEADTERPNETPRPHPQP